MKNNDIKNVLKSFYTDKYILSLIIIIILISFVVCLYFSVILGIFIQIQFLFGCIIATVLLRHKHILSVYFDKLTYYLGFKELTEKTKENCDICGTKKCKRHFIIKTREPWKGLFVDKDLDRAVDSFYTRILTSFVESWFSLLSNDEDFVQALKQNLREATCRLILKLKSVNAPLLITNKLLPCAFGHYELIEKMLADGIPMKRLAQAFTLNEYAIHPACINRQSELNYLRAVAKCLIPHLCNHEYFHSKVFFSLARELLACWVLLPLMDVISDPNLLNLLIIVATNKNTTSAPPSPSPTTTINAFSAHKKIDRVIFLENFVKKNIGTGDVAGATVAVAATAAPDAATTDSNSHNNNTDQNDNILTDQHQLYAFMQFLKKEGVVDLLRFYLDVDNLNMELLDPKITTDPAKLSSLYQQSERLLKSYQQMMANEGGDNPSLNRNSNIGISPVNTLIEAHEDVKRALTGKWKKAFQSTPEYFRLIYGTRTIHDTNDNNSKLHEQTTQTGPVSRLGSKLKGAIRGAIDGAPIEAIEVPTVWDAFTDEPHTAGGGNQTIYNSVTQKLRKERGQNLDNFIITFMQSIEQSTDIGEDVIKSSIITAQSNLSPKKTKKMQSIQYPHHHHHRKPIAPGRNLVFGDLFEIRHFTSQFANRSIAMHNVRGPSKCFIYILVKILKTKLIIVRLILGFINVSKRAVDTLICKLIDKLIRIGLYEPRLAILISTLENHLFGPKEPEPSSAELLERQRQAKSRLDQIYNGLGPIMDVIQSPPINKHLMYCLFDIIICELYPELEHNHLINSNPNQNPPKADDVLLLQASPKRANKK